MKKKILVVRFSSLGDAILTTAIFPSLKASWPEGEVVVLTKSVFADVFSNNPSIDRVIGFDSEKESFSELAKRIGQEKFDIIIDLHANLRSYFLRVLAGPPLAIAVHKATLARWLLLLFKFSTNDLRKTVRERILGILPRLDISVVSTETQLFTTDVPAVLSKFDLPPGRNLIGIAPGAKHNTKMWPWERFAESANRLGAFPNTTIVLLGDSSDISIGEKMVPRLVVDHKNLIGKTSLSELKDVVSQLKFLLTNDSALLHMGEAFKIPLVVLFGPTVRGFGFAPYRPTSRVVETINLTCRPCTLHGDPDCPLKHHRCMMDLDVSAAMFAASAVLPHLSVEPMDCSMDPS